MGVKVQAFPLTLTGDKGYLLVRQRWYFGILSRLSPTTPLAAEASLLPPTPPHVVSNVTVGGVRFHYYQMVVKVPVSLLVFSDTTPAGWGGRGPHYS